MGAGDHTPWWAFAQRFACLTFPAQTLTAMKPMLLVWLALRGVPEFTATREQVARWAARVPELEVVFADSQEAFVRNLSKATYAFTFRFSEAWLPLTYRMRWMATPAAGKELLGARIPNRIRLTQGAFHGAIMAETAVGMLLAVRRGLLPGLGLCSASEPWPALTPGRGTVAGSTAVILGYGHIGRAIGEKLGALGVRIHGVTRANLGALDALLPQADALFLALPATPETDRLMDARRLALLPRHAVLANLGRGNAVDEAALCAALSGGTLHAAFLDVMGEEPYPGDGPLRSAPRCFLLPHASAFAPDYLDRAFEEWLGIWRRDFATQG